MPSPTSTTTPPFRVAPILFQCYCTTSCHLKAARWYHESGGQERGGICWGQGWAPITHHPGHGDHENRGGARPGWHPVLQPFRNVDIGYKPWLPSICCQNLRGKHTVQLNQIGQISANCCVFTLFYTFTFGLSCNTMICTADGRGKSFDN